MIATKRQEKKIKDIIIKIVECIDPQKIILSGSNAYGTPHKNSDIDLLVVVNYSSQPRYKRAREIRKHLWGIINIPKDILVYTESEINEWKNVKEAFITSIIEKGKVLYENEKFVPENPIWN